MLRRASSPGPLDRTSAAGDQLSVAVVDQIPLFREALSVRLLRDPGMRLVGVTGQANAAVLLRERLAVDVLVVDATLDPRAQLTRRITKANAALTVVMLVREPYLTSPFLATVLDAGVHGLVRHASPPERILEAIRRSRTEGRYVDPTLAPFVAAGRGVPPVAGLRALSNREFQVLHLIADGLSNKGIADTLVLSVETVRTHIKGVLRKLEARDRAHAVARGFRLGLLAQHGERIPSADGGAAQPGLDGRIPVARGQSLRTA
jgi:DNA-binding NarL/FixJ family response regulator